MKIDDIPEEPNYLPLKNGIIFKPVTNDVICKDETKPPKSREYDIRVLCITDGFEYTLSLSQSRNKKIIFNLVKQSIKLGYKPIQLVIEKVGNGNSWYNNYDSSFIIDNSKNVYTITEEQPKVEEEETEPEIDTMKLTPEIFSKLPLEKKKEVVIRFGQYVKNLKVTSPSGSVEQPFSTLRIDISNDGKYGANKISHFSNICINQQLYPHNLDAYKKYYELFYQYFLELDDLSLSTIDADMKKRNIDGRYEAFRKEYKKIKGVSI